MANENDKSNCPLCKCETCCKWIPVSAAVTAEGKDYVRHFCGPDCYEKWCIQQKQNEQGTKGKV